ncbi:hypothetical protein ACUZ9N_00325 [Mycoplasmopsis gallinarum]
MIRKKIKFINKKYLTFPSKDFEDNKVNNKGIIFKYVNIAIYLALFLLSGLTVYFGYIPLWNTQITYLPIIVVFATVHLGFAGAMTAGLGFGFSSFLAAMMLGVIKYQYPDISILPRVLLGLIVYAIYRLLRMNEKNKLWKFAFLSILASILNIALVLSMQYLHNLYSPLRGILPIKEWILLHIPTLVIEPTVGLILGILLFWFAKMTRKKYLQRLNMSY